MSGPNNINPSKAPERLLSFSSDEDEKVQEENPDHRPMDIFERVLSQPSNEFDRSTSDEELFSVLVEELRGTDQEQGQPASSSSAAQPQLPPVTQVTPLHLPQESKELPLGKKTTASTNFLNAAQSAATHALRETNARNGLNAYNSKPFSKEIYFKLFFELGSALLGQGKYDEAEVIFEKLLLSAYPNKGDDYFLFRNIAILKEAQAICLISQNKDLNKAVDLLQDCVERAENPEMGIYNRRAAQRALADGSITPGWTGAFYDERTTLSFYNNLFLALEKLGEHAEIFHTARMRLQKPVHDQSLKEFLQGKYEQYLANDQASSSSTASEPQSSSAAAFSLREMTPEECLEKAREASDPNEKEQLLRDGLHFIKNVKGNAHLKVALNFELFMALYDSIKRIGLLIVVHSPEGKRHLDSEMAVDACLNALESLNHENHENIYFDLRKLLLVKNLPFEPVQKFIERLKSYCIYPSSKKSISPLECDLLSLELLEMHGKDTAAKKQEIQGNAQIEQKQIQAKEEDLERQRQSLQGFQGKFNQLLSRTLPALEPLDSRGIKREGAPERERQDSAKKHKGAE